MLMSCDYGKSWLRHRANVPRITPLEAEVIRRLYSTESFSRLSKGTDQAADPELPDCMIAPLSLPPLKDVHNGDEAFVTIVSGVSQSGAMLVMRMLMAGGMEALVDEHDTSKADPAELCLDYAKVHALFEANDWLDEARGKVVLVTPSLIPALPQAYHYRVVMALQDTGQAIGWHVHDVGHLGQEDAPDHDDLASENLRQLRSAGDALDAHEVPVLFLSEEDVKLHPSRHADRLTSFLDVELDLRAMAGVVGADRNGA